MTASSLILSLLVLFLFSLFFLSPVSSLDVDVVVNVNRRHDLTQQRQRFKEEDGGFEIDAAGAPPPPKPVVRRPGAPHVDDDVPSTNPALRTGRPIGANAMYANRAADIYRRRMRQQMQNRPSNDGPAQPQPQQPRPQVQPQTKSPPAAVRRPVTEPAHKPPQTPVSAQAKPDTQSRPKPVRHLVRTKSDTEIFRAPVQERDGKRIAMMSPSKLIATQDAFGNQNVEAQMAGARSKAQKAYPDLPPAEALKKFYQEGLFHPEKGKTVPVWIDPDGGVHLVDAHHRAQQALKAGVDIPVEIVQDFRGTRYINGKVMQTRDFQKAMFRGEKGNLVSQQREIYARAAEIKRQNPSVKDPIGQAVAEFHTKRQSIRDFPSLGDNPTRSAMGTVFHENRMNADLFKDYKQFDVQPWLESRGTSLRKIADAVEQRTGRKIAVPENDPDVVFELRGRLLQPDAVQEMTKTRIRGDMVQGKMDKYIRTLNTPETQKFLANLEVVDLAKLDGSKLKVGFTVEQIAQELKARNVPVGDDIYKDPNVRQAVQSRVQEVMDKNMARKNVLVTGLIQNSRKIFNAEKVLRENGVDGALFQRVALDKGQIVGDLPGIESSLAKAKEGKSPQVQAQMDKAWSEWNTSMKKSANIENTAMLIPNME